MIRKMEVTRMSSICPGPRLAMIQAVPASNQLKCAAKAQMMPVKTPMIVSSVEIAPRRA